MGGPFLEALYIHPVKSCRAVRVSAAEVEREGLAGDRRFMVVDSAGKFLTQREHPEMAAIDVELGADGALALRLEGGESLSVRAHATGRACTVRVWRDDVQAEDLGDEVAAWLERAIGRAARLVRMAPGAHRAADPRRAREGDRVAFADGYPFLALSMASIEEAARRAGVPPDPRRFRPNIVVGGVDAFEEDGWRGLRVGAITFYVVDPCARCAVVDVDPARAERDGAMLRSLASFRRQGNRVLFGQNLVHDGVGTLRVGDAVEVFCFRRGARRGS